MTPELKKVVDERLQILPQVLQDKLRDSTSLKTQLLSLEKGYNFSPEQMVIIENEVTLTLLAFAPYHDLPTNIARELGMEESAVLPIVGKILSEIFTPEILKQLDKILSNQTDTKISTPASLPQQPSQTPTPPSPPVAPPEPSPQAPAWQHIQQVAPHEIEPPAPIPANLPIQNRPIPASPTPPTVSIPQYQKPLTAVPEYRNADLYQKP